MKFKLGQEVICMVPRSGWFCVDAKTGKTIYTGLWPFNKPKPLHGPDVDEIVTVVGHIGDAVFLKEYPEPGVAFLEKFFEPLSDLTEIYKVLEKEPFEL